MPAAGDSRSSRAGFEGGVAGLGLADLIQLNGANRLTGCFRVHYGEQIGLIYFRDGQIVHAELGGKLGQDAFVDILDWPGGRFDVEPNLLPGTRTIQKTIEHLLLDSHRVLDERRAGRNGEAISPEPAPPAAPKASAVDVARAVPEVTGAVVLNRECRRVGKGGFEEDALAGEVGYLALAAVELGELLQAGDFRAGAVRGERRHLLLYATRTHYLGVSTAPESDPDAVDAALRAALGKVR